MKNKEIKEALIKLLNAITPALGCPVNGETNFLVGLYREDLNEMRDLVDLPKIPTPDKDLVC